MKRSTLLFLAASLSLGGTGPAQLVAPNQFLSLLDVMKRSGSSDSAIGLIEANANVAPELQAILGQTIRGITYKLRIRKTLGVGAFRNANEGVATSKNTYAEGIAECFLYDAQMIADKAVADADDRGAAVLLAEEAQGVTRGSLLELGKQVYYGTAADARGFLGLKQMTAAAMKINKAGAIANKQTCVVLAYVAPDGVGFRFGNNGQVIMPDSWTLQQVTAPLTGSTTGQLGRMTAWTNGMTAWIGMQMAVDTQVGYIANVDSTSLVTDSDISDLISKFPLLYRPNRIFMTPTAVSFLQRTRQTNGNGVVTVGPGNAGMQVPRPTESNGIPITETNSISDTEAVEAF